MPTRSSIIHMALFGVDDLPADEADSCRARIERAQPMPFAIGPPLHK